MASARMVVAQQAVKEGGFSGTIRPNQGQTVSLIDLKGYAGQGLLILEVLTEILHVNHFGHGVAPFLRGGTFANSHIGQDTNDTTSWQRPGEVLEDVFCQVLISRTKEDTSGVNEDEAHNSRCEGFFHQISPFLYFYIYYRKTTQKALAQNVMTQYDICHQKKPSETRF